MRTEKTIHVDPTIKAVSVHAPTGVWGLRGALSAHKDEFSALMVFFEQGSERRLLLLGQRAAHL